ncbi:MAG: hypothetical protein Q7I89_05165 [Syntrophales bacterium]|nr:hypothetical protein [Syntrophales bacterium]
MRAGIRCKFVAVVLLTTFALMVTGVCAFAASKPVPEGIKKDLKAVLAKLEKECPEGHVFIEKMKKAGASYFQELTAPTAKAQSYTDAEIQRMMVGVYHFDMSYAMVFGKNKESLKAGEAIDVLLTKLGYNDPKIVAQYKKAMKGIDGPNVKQVLKDLDKAIDAALPKMINTQEGLDVPVDAAYGWIIEALYLVTETVAQKNYDPKFLVLLNEQKKSIKMVIDTLNVFKNNKELAAIVERNERLPLLQDISKRLKDPKKMGKEDVEAIRTMVAKARAEIVK